MTTTPVELVVIGLLYTPLLQLLVLYAIFYRHELSRLAHPLKERTGTEAWADALQQLALARPGELKNVPSSSDPKVMKYLIKVVTPAALLGALCPELFLPAILALVPALSIVKGPLLFLLQFIPAAYFIVFLRLDYLGPPPIHRHTTTLPLPRMSSMVRCLGETGKEDEERR